MRKGSEKSLKEPDSSLVTQRHCALGQQSGFTSLSTEARTAAAPPCLTLCNPADCSLPVCPRDCSQPGSSVHGIFLARILEWVAISYSRGSSWPRNQTLVSCVSCIAGGFLMASHWGSAGQIRGSWSPWHTAGPDQSGLKGGWRQAVTQISGPDTLMMFFLDSYFLIGSYGNNTPFVNWNIGWVFLCGHSHSAPHSLTPSTEVRIS